MAAVADRVVLSDSLTRTRPHFSAYMRSDSNAGGNLVQQIEQQRQERHMKFPSLTGRKDVDSFKDPQNLSDPAFRKFNDEGDHRPDAPNRFADNIIDPLSGFVSVGGDVDRNTGHTRIHSMVPLNNTPQSYNPRELTSVRLHESAPPDIRRQSERAPGQPYPWSGRKVSDASLRASLGGWTSDKDPRKEEEDRLKGNEAPKTADKNKALRDSLALKFMYTSSTQRAYEEIPWDNMVRQKRWAPTTTLEDKPDIILVAYEEIPWDNMVRQKRWAPITTLEDKPDMISQVFTKTRYEPKALEYQNVGRSWDWFQTRRTHYKKNIPIPGTTFTSACSRTKQIPNYSGCIGGDNILEVDNPDEPFTPYTVKRVNIPRPADTAFRPDIPNYTGCTLYTSDRLCSPMHANTVVPEPQTTLRVHRSLPIEPNLSEFRKRSYMSKMVTTVPPSNPFNRIDKAPIQLGEEPQGTAASPHQQAIMVS